DAELLFGAADVVNFVSGGGVLLFNDAAVDGSAINLIFPDIPASALVSDTGASADDVNFLRDISLLADGPGGVIGDGTLDGASPATWGYVGIEEVSDLPAAFLVSRANPGEGASVLLRYGDGFLIYSTVTAADHLGDGDAAGVAMTNFTANLVDFANDLSKLFVNELPAGNFGGSPDRDLYVLDDAGVTVTAGAGADLVYGGLGADGISGEAGADILSGGGGKDRLGGGHSRDQLWGGTGNDKLLGGNGFDFLVGGSGNDRIRGGGDGDTMFGNAGDDTITGGKGLDWMSGGDGSDRFIFRPGDSGTADNADTIVGFEGSGVDVIDITAFGPLTYSGSAFEGAGPRWILVSIDDHHVLRIDINGDSVSDCDIVIFDDGFLGLGDVDYITGP
ncbi:MAG: calcium-binding protein, partial [Caulobacteraceae bacterium]